MDINGIRPPQGSRAKQIPLQSNLSAQPRRRIAPIVPVEERKSFPLPRYYAPERPEKIVRKHLSTKKLLLRGAAACLVLLLSTGGFLSWKAYVKFHKVFHGTSTVAALASKPVTPDLLKGEGDGRVNILLLGIGGPGHDGPDLTDTIVVLSIDPVNNNAVMLSIPRDLWVQQPVNYFGKQQKINAAYESGKYHYLGKMDASSANAGAVEAGFTSIDQVVKNVTDLNVNYHMLVNFQAFQQAVDTVGGVTVNVPSDLIDPTFSWMNHGSPVIARAGVQSMNGYMALEYARSRETSSDFARGERQRQILVALKDKVLTAGTLSNPAKIDALMNAFGDNVYSDLSTQGASRFFTIMKKIGDNKISSVGFTDEGHKLVTTDHIGTTSIVRPVAGFDNYAAIQSYVHSATPDGFLTKENAPVVILGNTAAIATASATVLKTLGYNVISSGVATQPVNQAVVVDLSKGKDPFTRHYLESRFATKAVTTLPAGVTLTDPSAKFVILEAK